MGSSLRIGEKEGRDFGVCYVCRNRIAMSFLMSQWICALPQYWATE